MGPPSELYFLSGGTESAWQSRRGHHKGDNRGALMRQVESHDDCRRGAARVGCLRKDIVYLDLDSKRYRKVKSPDQLEGVIKGLATDGDLKYLFIDEVQNVSGFEEVVNAYRNDGGFSIFLTGSNSYLLSGELATKLTGRYVEVEMFTLGFSEYLGMKGFLGQPAESDAQEFERWLSRGGFPHGLLFRDDEARDDYVRNVVDQIFEKDIGHTGKSATESPSSAPWPTP
ncbi:AAA family ATPase [Slackia exigua]